ncbi:TetR/AcrR family transcriptional regulator [Granulicoccus sp. GXG6511]|uniref:TetR/AcrR family transcriptional regulator n=1 Tax=Granulicoccus sp. GXG6511 TaxID=3381351 RepID=UPI003D7E2F47
MTDHVQAANGAMGRPARMPRDQRRLQLLDVAGQVFADKGYHNAAMDDIAEAAGVSKPVLYQHFPSKLDLYLALVDRASEEIVDLVRAAIAGTTNNSERVSAALGSFYEFVAQAGKSFRFVFESDLIGDAQVSDRIWQAHRDLAEAIGQSIAHDTRMSPERARLLGISLVGLAQVGARYWVSELRDELSAHEASSLISTLAWRGIRGFPLAE